MSLMGFNIRIVDKSDFLLLKRAPDEILLVQLLKVISDESDGQGGENDSTEGRERRQSATGGRGGCDVSHANCKRARITNNT